jgi:uncharacterized protein YneF (UPF0154 family)
LTDEQKPIEINLAGDSSLATWSEQITEPFRKELYAKSIALWIVIMAFVSMVLVLSAGYFLIYRSMSNPENAKAVIQGAVIPLLEKAATFFTTVFSPLLAFILGYYFGQRQAQRRRTD